MALAIKMIAYVGIVPTGGAFVHMVPRRSLLVALDLLQAAVAVCLLFVNEAWQVYALIFLLRFGSAAFLNAARRGLVSRCDGRERDG
jgi:hypothetical protein